MKVSLITTTFNSEKTLEDTILSVIKQSYYNIEYIIIDGFSKDNTLKIIDKYRYRIDVVLSEPDSGIYDALNKGIKLATGDVIGIIHSDDVYSHCNVLSKVVEHFEYFPNSDMIIGDVSFFKGTNTDSVVRFYSSRYFSSWQMRFGFMPAHPATFVKRAVYDNLGYYSLEYKIAADFEWFLRSLVVNNVKYTKLSMVLVKMRIGGISTAGIKNNLLISSEMLNALRSNNLLSSYFFVSLRLPIKLALKYFSFFR